MNKVRKASGLTPSNKSKEAQSTIGRNELNSRDHAGLTLLLRAASSTNPDAREFAQALIEHPMIDLYAQDAESGWNALHRSLYSGNISIARMLLKRERDYLTSHHVASASKVGLLIKTKDHEGYSPFDLYNASISIRSLQHLFESSDNESDSESDDDPLEAVGRAESHRHPVRNQVLGDELYVFGSNKNMSLGVGDEDDRQFPERIQLQRPAGLVRRLHQDFCAERGLEAPEPDADVSDVPSLVADSPIVIKDMVMSKLHSAVLTTDPVSNLYVCGVGRGGRLGLGDENTRFRFVPVDGLLADKKVTQVALGQNHTLAITADGELWTWGLNTDFQLGYAVAPPTRPDEEPMCVTPRQVFGSLKKDVVLGIAASGIHSVAHTESSLYCWGRNNGQLALMDSDSRSLDTQQAPRKVAASLLSAPIEMVSATDRATTVLLANHSVWVFANYGYNLVKFPIPDVFANYNMTASHSNRYEPGRRKICYVTSGGDTIAAVTARGDLFTMQLTQKAEASQPATSTTNPTKIKGALTTPQCIWDSRKDGVVSVGVGEHGSVIICTESGAVWKRVKRLKGKTAAFARADLKGRDFKFERVPYITNCVSVRSSTFGAFAAIRKDAKVMSEEIKIQGQGLWSDVSSLLCLEDFRPNASKEVDVQRSPWETAIARERPGSIPWRVLQNTSEIQGELRDWLHQTSKQLYETDMEVCTSLAPDLRIPAHAFVLAGRGSRLRDAFAELRESGSYHDQEAFSLEQDGNKIIMTVFDVDILTLLNVLVYAYQDTMVPVWKYTRESPSEAARFRQVRNELMKLSTRLGFSKLEAAARLQIGIERQMDSDFRNAIQDQRYFEDGDVLIELEDEEILAHSEMLCRRCPFFEGMFYGRSQGRWLSERQAAGEAIRVDLSHISYDTFYYVLTFLYSDIGPEMFDGVAASNIDEFSELVLDVMGVANELMLDRLSQICQSIIAKFVTTRNISVLLNEISACSHTSFKDTGLEYVCLQLETMLENHLLEYLDEDLLHELDEVVRDNQLSRLPFAKSGRAELKLQEDHPELAGDIEEERRIRLKEIAYKYSQREDDRKLSSSFKARTGSLDEVAGSSPLADRSRRKSRNHRNEPFSPHLRPKTSTADLMFDMDDDSAIPRSPASPALKAGMDGLDLDADPVPQLPKSWQKSKMDSGTLSGTTPVFQSLSPLARSPVPQGAGSSHSKSGAPWASNILPTSKLDLKNIMSEANPSKSALSAGLAQQGQGSPASKSPAQHKMSQKEKKKQMQLQAEAEAAESSVKAKHVPWEKVASGDRPAPAPWKAAAPPSKVSVKEAMSSESSAKDAVAASIKPLVASETSKQPTRTRTASPASDTRFPGQSRASSSPSVPTASNSKSNQKPVVPHSKSYMAPARKTEDVYGASMADIIEKQKHDQRLAKEAVAKRSLQEIQQEQEFQDWWDQESRRVQEEEHRRQHKGTKQGDKPSGQRGRKGRNSKGQRPSNDGTSSAAAEDVHTSGTTTAGRPEPQRGGKGPKGRGRSARITSTT